MERPRILELDGLRGVAILMVVAGHYALDPQLIAGSPVALSVFQILVTGVDLFFVLSGFLITRILLDARAAPTYFTTFYGRRFCRIFPLYYLVITVVFLQGLVWRSLGHPALLYGPPMPFWVFPLFVQNFGQAWFPDANGWIALSMAWSLALEEQFYLTLPAVVRTMRVSVIAIGCAVLLTAAPAARYLIVDRGHSVGALALAALRADALAAGVLLAILFEAGASPRRGVVAAAVAMGIVGVVLTDSRLAFLRETAVIVVYGGAVWLAVSSGLSILRARLLRFFGMISYALYLLHQLVLVTLHSLLLHAVPSAGTTRARLVTAMAFGVTVAMCAISWRYVEAPLVRWGHRRYAYQSVGV